MRHFWRQNLWAAGTVTLVTLTANGLGRDAADTAPAGAGPQGKKPAHWAFQTPRRPPVPTVKDPRWVAKPIDAFVLARLESEGIRPAPAAGRAMLIRRLSLDLTGLPPTPAEVDAFVNDRRNDACEQLVDRLLASPHFGERWGKHWLDVARYSDTDGYTGEKDRPHAWRFRTWVIDALNRDLPFDQFTIEQLAGDLLPNATVENRVATGFHRNTLTNRETGTDPEEFRVRQVVDRVNTTGTAWLGLTIACAECHSHKYDPISQREYYGLYAFFNSLKEVDIPVSLPQTKAQVLEELPEPRPTFVHVRGDFLRPGEAVPPHTPAVLPPLGAGSPFPSRLDLARWLASPGHPLTARVAVNRFWQQLFGFGLVRTENDFGVQGDPSTHPQLLDWLATEFVARGWSTKAMVRLMVLSSTYRQASTPRPELASRDPKNLLLARQNRFRVEAEIVRDLALAAAGLLDRRVGGASFRPPVPTGVGNVIESKWPDKPSPDQHRRGLYIVVQRTVPHPLLTTFDAPDANVPCTRRERSNSPLQALALLNDETFLECARALGLRLASETGQPPETRLRQLFRLCLAREPAAWELRRLRLLLEEQTGLYQQDPELARQALRDPRHAPGAATAAAWIGVARTVMNLDEFITRE